MLWVLHRPLGVLMGLLPTCTTSCVHCLPHQAEGDPNMWTTISKHTYIYRHARMRRLSGSEWVAAIPTTRAPTAIPTTLAPTYAPDGAPPWPLRMVELAHSGGPLSAAAVVAMAVRAASPWQAPWIVHAVPHVQGARCRPR